jgi:tetratricopeptide (TPR) repeat protein
MQRAEGSFIAQAEGGSTAIVQVFQSARPVEVESGELAEAERRLEELPVDDILEPSGLPAGSHMPWRRNPVFVGREADLKALASTLKAGGTAAVGQSAAVTGLGGIGKTQLASEFAYRYGRYFAGGVFWLSFADGEAVAAEIAACGGPRGLNLHPEFNNHPLDAQVGMVASAWHSELPRLLVFDNCEDEELLEAWAPRSGGCRVLVTSRRAEWRPELGVNAVPLGVLERGESVALLHKHRPDLGEDDADLVAIAEELGDLPLALHLAGSFLARYRHAPQGTPDAYLSELRRPDLLDHRSMTLGGSSPTGHEQHVARTFALSHGQLDTEDPTDVLALATLARAAWFALGEPIPRHLLRLSAGVDGEDGNQGLGFEDALLRLAELGLLEQEEGGSLVLHRLLGAFVRSEADKAAGALAAVEVVVLSEASRLNGEGYPAPLLAWQPHLREVAEHAAEAQTDSAGGLLNALGYHLNMIADYAGAKAAYERALAIDEVDYGPDHPNVAVCVNNLGGVLQVQGDLAGAKAAFERALAIDEAAHGPDHPNVARDVNNLGSVLQDQGNLASAKAAYERALAIDEKALGPDHPDVAIRVNNLGSVLQDQGNLAGAKAALERALAIDEAALGPDHPNVAIRVNNLGSVLQDQGDLAGAKAAFERALAIFEKALGPDHPSTATVKANIDKLRPRD